MLLPRFSLIVSLALGPLATACATSSGDSPTGSTSSAQLGAPGVPNAADTGCNVFLRDIGDAENGASSSNCVAASGTDTCWVVFTGHVDISSEALLEGDQPYVQYQSGTGPWYSAPTTPTIGAGTGFQRYSFNLEYGTAVVGQPFPTIQVIPYLITTVGTHLYDHNVYADQNYVLNAVNDWNIGYNGDYCYEPPPLATATVMFASGWTDSVVGSFEQGGKLVVDYALARLPQCEDVSAEGLPAWATTANAYFQPGGELFTGVVSGAYDSASSSWTSLVFERDIPTNATSVALWFATSGDGCSTAWDSHYGQNYVFSVAPASF